MHWLDITILVLLAVPTLIGLRMGIIKAVLSLVGVIIGVLLAGNFYEILAAQLTFITQTNIAKIVAFALILFSVMLISAIIAAVLKWIVSIVMLGWVNRLGGAVFGFLLGGITCGALLAAWVTFFGVPGAVTGSILARVLQDYLPLVLELLPDEFGVVRSFF